MKNKHNKKRNTAFLYEVLIREMTRAVVAKDKHAKILVTDIIKNYFKKNTCLYEELQLYKALTETTDLNDKISERLLLEVKASRVKLNEKKLFNEQTRLITKINNSFNSSVFSSFIPNYKSLATVYQIFNCSVSIKDKVFLEQLVLNNMQSKTIKEEDTLDNIDNLVFKTFIKKFNKSYGEILTEGQKQLVTNYIFSFSDNGVGLKSYLNEEIGRLREIVKGSLTLGEITKDSDMVKKTNKVLEFLDSFKEKQLTENDIEKLLNIQSLADEVQNDGN
tara:strand:- start:848 stop:1678 length:831 start_codon:yes stop_codon:yes gene_type:complete